MTKKALMLVSTVLYPYVLYSADFGHKTSRRETLNAQLALCKLLLEAKADPNPEGESLLLPLCYEHPNDPEAGVAIARFLLNNEPRKLDTQELKVREW